MKLLLANRGNPDHGQDPNRPVFDTPADEWVDVATIEQAISKAERYRSEYDLGGGNWFGGVVLNDDGSTHGLIRYNGRFMPVSEWDSFDAELAEIILSSVRKPDGKKNRKPKAQPQKQLACVDIRQAIVCLQEYLEIVDYCQTTDDPKLWERRSDAAEAFAAFFLIQ